MNVTADLLRSLGTDRKGFEARCESIAALVSRNDKAACEAILRIYDRQTADEKQADVTKHNNGIGFQECDAKFGGFIARLYRAGRMPYADRMVRVRRMALKYRRQLAVLSFIKERAKQGYKGVVIEEVMRLRGTPVVTVRPTALTEADLSGVPRQLFVDEVNNVCSACGSVRCPDGCCCAC
jgi:hypothetical protein